MNQPVKSVASFVVILMFLLFGLASELQDQAFGPGNKYKEELCGELASVITYEPNITINIFDHKNKEPLEGVKFLVNIYYYKGNIKFDSASEMMVCEKKLSGSSTFYPISDENGLAIVRSNPYLFNLRMDMVKVLIYITDSQEIFGKRIFFRNHQNTSDIEVTFAVLEQGLL